MSTSAISPHAAQAAEAGKGAHLVIFGADKAVVCEERKPVKKVGVKQRLQPRPRVRTKRRRREWDHESKPAIREKKNAKPGAFPTFGEMKTEGMGWSPCRGMSDLIHDCTVAFHVARLTCGLVRCMPPAAA